MHKLDPLDWIDPELVQLDDQGLLRGLTVRQSPHVAGLVQLDGRQYVNFGANDYLGIAADSRLVDAVRHWAGQVGWGAGASPSLSGRGVVHQRLEQELASFEQCQSVALFPTGYAANVGVITALAGDGDGVFSDRHNHASIIDGCRLSRARTFIYDHCDTVHLHRLLEQSRDCRRRLIVTDSLFSMDGDFAPLEELCDLADRFSAMLMVDEAHATGVWGALGRGACEHLGVEDRVAVKVGTLSKALGSHGGFVASTSRVIQWIINKSRTFIFSTAAPEAMSAATLAALEIVRQEPQRRQHLQTVSAKLRNQLRHGGWNVGDSHSQIIPVVLGSAEKAVQYSRRLRERGFHVPAIRPPAVPVGASMLRISLSAAHSDDQVAALVESLSALKRKS